jgi:hypothetical protein
VYRGFGFPAAEHKLPWLPVNREQSITSIALIIAASFSTAANL